MRRFGAALTMLVLAAPATAETISGVELAPQYRFDDGTKLTLHGAGVREKYFFDIYVAALYLPETGQSAEAIRSREQAARIEMHFVYDEISRERLVDAWRSGIEANNAPEVLDTIEGRLAQFLGLMRGVEAGDTVTLTYRPGEGTRIVGNGELLGTIPGGVFFRALAGVFVGPNPPDRGLKRGILGLNR